MYNVWKAALPRVEPRPVLAARGDIFGDGNDAGYMRVTRDRQWAADQPRGLGQPPTGAAHLRLDHLADVNGGIAAGEALGKAAAGRQRQRGPVGLRQQRAKAQVGEFV